jgi:large subunit ribosomal protein L9e
MFKVRTINLVWFGERKQKCAVTSIATHIRNMIRGVTKGYKFKMRYAYAHFPIQANIINGNKAIEIKNFIGEKLVRKIDALEGVTITRKEEEKDQIWVQGTSLENVSQTCIH